MINMHVEDASAYLHLSTFVSIIIIKKYITKKKTRNLVEIKHATEWVAQKKYIISIEFEVFW